MHNDINNNQTTKAYRPMLRRMVIALLIALGIWGGYQIVSTLSMQTDVNSPLVDLRPKISQKSGATVNRHDEKAQADAGAEASVPQFDGERAYQDVRYQVDLGPRTPGSDAHAQVISWIQSESNRSGWSTEVQTATIMGHEASNIIARRDKAGAPWIILGAHYDTRPIADQDPDPNKRGLPIPGANDGASGVALLLELARILPPDLDMQIWMVFFDLEDNFGIPSWDGILGSRAFVSELNGEPDAVVVVDMIGDADLDIYLEGNSDPALSDEIWSQAAELGYSEYFIATRRHTVVDDHVPFIQVGIPAALIIDIDYDFWHTIADDMDKVSPHSLQVVGDTMLAWLLAGRN